MSRETDAKIAEWLGYKWHSEKKSSMRDPYWSAPDGKARGLPVFSTSDSAAITLLPVLVERNYSPTLDYQMGLNTWCFEIWEPDDNGADTGKFYDMAATATAPTIASAITSAIIQLIEREETK